jgi:hypothetical protein
MASNTIQTVWKLILDEGEAREGESTLQRIARVLKDKIGGEGSKAVDKTTEAIEKQTKALKENEDAAKKAGNASGGIGEAAGKVGGGLGDVGRLAGAGSLVGAGEGFGIVGDIGDAIEGLQGVGSTLAELGPIGAVAGVAMVALGVVISDFAAGAQKTADEINAAIDSMRSVADEIAGGATKEDIQESIDQLQFRRDLERDILAESTQAYEDFIQGIRDAFGVFAPLVEGIVKIVDPREEALKSQIEESNKLIGESEAKENAYNKALEKGLTSKADAAKAEEDRQKSQEKADREREAAEKKAAGEREKAANDAQRQAEQAAAKAEQIEQKRYNAAQKYGDALVDIARKSADDAKKLAQAARFKEIDNRRAFDQDMIDLSLDFQDSEREEMIKRQDEESADLRAHALTVTGIRDNALKDETDLLRKRDFLGAALVRENANTQIENENKAFLEAQAEKAILQKQEDAAQLREFDKARHERLNALKQANAEAQIQYKRDVEAQRESRKIAQREAAIARDRELRAASEMARALLGIHTQVGQAQVQLAANTLNQLRGITNTTNNNGNTVNGGMHFSVSGGAGGMTASQVNNQILSALGSVGLA